MKIIYNENPLCTAIELDDYDKEMLFLKIKIETLEDFLFSAQYDLANNKIASVKDDFDAFVKNSEAEYVNQRVIHRHLIDSLKESHGGDCICFPCSCTKCHAEELLGVHTIKGLGKHGGYRLHSLFEEDGMTLDKAISFLENYQTPIKSDQWTSYTQEEYEKYFPHWIKQAKDTAEWLKKYRDEHFSEKKLNAA